MTLNYKEAGQGEPLVLIHGLFGSLENLGAVARLMSESYKVYSVDLPNHGRSPHTNETDLESMCELLAVWMDRHDLKRAHFLGHSLGGKVAMELALRYPDRVNQLVVVDIAPVHYPPHHNEVFKGLLSFDPGTLSSRVEADRSLQEHVKEPAVRSFLLKNLVKSENSGFTWRMNLPVIHQGYEDLVKGNVAGKAFSGEVLFLKGAQSDYIQESSRAETVARFPNLSLKIIANTGHWLHAEKPDMVAKLVKNFLSS